MVYTYYPGKRRITKARHLRKTQTKAEAVLWEHLRNRKVEGLKFRRQQVIDEMIVDFFCAEKRIIFEVDGPYHEDPIQKVKDAERDQELKDLGFFVYHFTNDQIINDLENTLSQIRSILNSPLHDQRELERGRG